MQTVKAAALTLTFEVAETIRKSREIPSGVLYASLAGVLTLEGYEKLLGILQRADLIAVEKNHLIRWIGPELRA